MSNIRFNAVSPSVSGFNLLGLSYGGAWGDVNGDGYPDLWVNGHETDNNYSPHGVLYLNQGDGTFRDATAATFVKLPRYDLHGAAWADFDNDGDQDLAQLVGNPFGASFGTQFSNQFYVNAVGVLEDRASVLGVDDPLTTAWNPLWIDFNQDGLLDLVEGAQPRIDGIKAPPKIFQQRIDGTFVDASAITGFNLANAPYFLLSDLSGDGHLDLIAKNNATSRFTVYDTTFLPFKDITSATIPNAIAASDVAIADFNGDLRPDLYLTRSSGSVNDLYQNEDDKAVALLVVKKEEKGFQFDTPEAVTFDIQNYFNGKFSIPFNQVYIGANGVHPTSWKFTLSPQNPNVGGILPHVPGVDRGLYIGFDPTLQRWQLLLSSPDRSRLMSFIETTKPISQLTAIGFQANPPPPDDQLLINTGAGFIDQSDLAGINSIPIHGNNVVAGDFDNDMDQDIYIVTSRSVVNTPDILYENQGNGTFIAIADAGGAAGTEIGVGDFVTTTDYDLDGFLDLLVANGRGQKSLLNKDAFYELFNNEGNSNHWFEIDLQGWVSNRDGIGAQVFLTAGGVTQLREQSGGIHNQVQNHPRLHFGLADNILVQELVINWPSGRVQVVRNIPADQLVRIVEPAAIQVDQAVKYGSANWSYDAAAPFDDVDLFHPVSYSIVLASGDPLPLWIQFNTATGLITGTPSLGDRGTYALIVKATDAQGLSIDTPLTVAVTLFDAGQLLVSTTGNDILSGTLANDTVSYAYAIAPVTVSVAINGQQNTVGAGLDTLTQIDNVIGSQYNDSLTGNIQNNVLDGGAGNDILNGAAGADTLIGGRGNDTFVVNHVSDVVVEQLNEGTDQVYSSVTYTLSAQVEHLTLTGTLAINGIGNSQANNITGNAAHNHLNGEVGNDTLNGAAGADNLTGGLGNDTYVVDNIGDVITENLNEGIDRINSSVTYMLPVHVENLTLTGASIINGTGNNLGNVILGNAANNILSGGAGNDILNGGAGTNLLTGGVGNDVFRFTTIGHTGTITDYSVANDTIQIENAVFTALKTTGVLVAGQFRIGTQALDADDFIIYNNITGALLYDADGNGAVTALQIATVGGNLAMTYADVVVI